MPFIHQLPGELVNIFAPGLYWMWRPYEVVCHSYKMPLMSSMKTTDPGDSVTCMQTAGSVDHPLPPQSVWYRWVDFGFEHCFRFLTKYTSSFKASNIRTVDSELSEAIMEKCKGTTRGWGFWKSISLAWKKTCSCLSSVSLQVESQIWLRYIYYNILWIHFTHS